MRDRRLGRLSSEMELGEEGEIERYARRALATAPLPDLDQKVAHRESVRQEQEDRAPFVRVNPASVNNGVLGGQQVAVGSVLSGARPKQVVFWQGDDAESTAVTVTLFNIGRINAGFPTPNNGPPENRTFFYAPYANVRWGTRAVMAEAKVDIASGCQFTLGASCVFISVGLDAANVETQMEIGAMLSFFTTQKATPITCTQYNTINGTEDAPTNVATVVIPNFSRTVTVHRAGAVAFIIEVLDADNNVLYVYGQAVNTYMMDALPLANDAYAIRITNGGVTGQNFRSMFNLSF